MPLIPTGPSHERLRPPVQLADAIPRIEVVYRLARLQRSIVVRIDPESPRNLTNREAVSLAVVPEQVGERCHEQERNHADDVSIFY
jgi:hypothetical protein